MRLHQIAKKMGCSIYDAHTRLEPFGLTGSAHPMRGVPQAVIDAWAGAQEDKLSEREADLLGELDEEVLETLGEQRVLLRVVAACRNPDWIYAVSADDAMGDRVPVRVPRKFTKLLTPGKEFTAIKGKKDGEDYYDYAT